MKLFLISVIVWLAGGKLYAQQHLADSISKVLQQEVADTIRAYNLVMLAMYTEPLDMEKAHRIYQEAVDFSLSKNLDYYAGLALYYEATPLGLAGKYQLQMENLNRAADLFLKTDHTLSRRDLARVYGDISGSFRSMGKLDSAVVFSLKSIAILEGLMDNRRVATQCLNLAMIYQQLNLPGKQKEYVDKGLENARLAGNPSALMLGFLQQAGYYTSIYDFQKAKLYADSATVYYSDRFDFSLKQNYFLLKAGTFQNISQFDSAVYYFQKAYENGKTAGSRWNMTEPLMQIGYIHLQQKNYTDAEKFVKMGLEIAEADSVMVFMKEGYGTLSDIYAGSGRYKEAHDYLTRFNTIKDSLQSEERKKFALDLEKKYEVEKHTAQIQQLEAEKRIQELSLREKILIIQSLLGILFTILVVGLLILRNYRQKQKLQQQQIEKLEAEKLLAATEAVLKGEEQERSRLAKDLHDGLGGLLSGIKYSFQNMKENLILTPENAGVFERSLDMLDSSINEMRRVAHNLMPESVYRFGLDSAIRDYCADIHNTGILHIKYQSFGMDTPIPDLSVSVSVYRIVQELVNNILKHAEASYAFVQITRSDSALFVDVEDNGKGMDPDVISGKGGMGWRNINSRVEYLKGTLSLESSEGRGTSIHIEFPLS
ncbi:MAG: tetratricopeptide repeat-containing sensor histidine kinase [Bacteroidota bacterium]